MIEFNVVLFLYCVISTIWLGYTLIDKGIKKYEKKRYARNHFKLTERYRNEID